MCVGAPQDIKNVMGLRIDEKIGNHCLEPLTYLINLSISLGIINTESS